MAIIRSIAVGKARKSAGNVTFRTVRGRTIMSEKIAPSEGTRVPGQAMPARNALFGFITRYARMHAADINASFNQTKYGSQRNYFIKLNYVALSAAFETLLEDPYDDITDTMIENAVTTYATSNPTSIYRVRLSGYPDVYLSGAWKSSENPTPAKPSPNAPSITAVSLAGTPLPNNGNVDAGNAEQKSLAITGKNLVTSMTVSYGGSSGDVALSTLSPSVSSSTNITCNITVSSSGPLVIKYNGQQLWTCGVTVEI